MKKFIQKTLAVGVAASLAGSALPALAAEPQTVEVQLNGKNLVFSDAVPQVKDERTFLPFRAVFEALGAEVSYEGTEITAVRGGRTVTFTLDVPQATISENGETWTLDMDVAPYVDEETWRTYVPVRFAAQTLNCTVGWDQDAYTAVIVDPGALLNDAMEGRTFTYLEQLIEYSQKYNVGPWDMSMTLNGTAVASNVPVKFGGSCNGSFADGNKFDLSVGVTLDLRELMQELVGSEEPDEETAEFLALFETLSTEGISLTMRGSETEGVIYTNLKGSVLTQAGMNTDAWYSISVEDALAMSGLDLEVNMDDLLSASQSADPGEQFSALFDVASLDSVSDYAEIIGLIDTFSDQSFLEVGPGEYATTIALPDNTASFTLGVYTDGSAVNGFYINVEGTDDETGASLNIFLNMDPQDKMSGQVDVAVEDVIISMDLNAQYSQGDGNVDTAPPAGATIINLIDFFNGEG